MNLRRALLAALCAAGALVGSAEAELRVVPARLGNVFLAGEEVAIPVTGDGDRVLWLVRDYSGNSVARGSRPLADGRATIRVSTPVLGYFSLELTDQRGATTLATIRSSFAILTPPPQPLATSRFGTQTHFAQGTDPALLPLLSQAGIVHFRDEHYWASIELQRGKYTFPPKFSGFMEQARQTGRSPLLTVNWGNPHYDFEAGPFTAPHTPAGRQGYASYIDALLGRYGAQISQVEIWNEYNAGTFITGPATADRPRFYTEMLRTAAAAIRARRPDVRIVAGATVPVAHGFLREIFARGALADLDIVSVHPYLQYPEDAELEITGLRQLIAEHHPGGPKPIWATEFSMDARMEADRRPAAAYLARIAVQLLTAGVERMYYYLMEDDTLFPCRGLVGKAVSPAGANVPNPAYAAYANLIRQLDGWQAEGRIATGVPTTYVYRFAQAGRQRHVAWATSPATLELTGPGPMSARDIMGNRFATSPNGTMRLPGIGLDPIYIDGSLDRIAEAGNPLIADSLASYAPLQESDGWSYGQAAVPAGTTYEKAAFRPLKWGIWNAENYRWIGSGDFLFIAGATMHPAGDRVVRRWTSSFAGMGSISGHASRGPGGDGVEIQIVADGKIIEQFTLDAGQSRAFEVRGVTLSAGTTIDFIVDQRADNTFDATEFTARILRDTAPGSTSR